MLHTLCTGRLVHFSGQAQAPRRLFTTVQQHTRHPVRATAESPLVELIVSDVDGTLLDSQQLLSPHTERVVCAAAVLGVPLVVATGKARGPWTQEVLPRLNSSLPGVFLQGLLIYDGQGRLMHSQEMEHEVALAAIGFAETNGLTLTAYCGDRILCAQQDEHTDRLLFYKEPTPEAVGPLAAIVGKIPIQKLIFMASQPRIEEVRPEVEACFGGRASLTTAIFGMLEVLPLGASKGAGVERVLQELGIAPERVMAIGDGENDVEMLRLCGLAVAMGNAGPEARGAADYVTGSNDEDGMAAAVEKFVLLPRGAVALS